jgi:hypothetical protein
MIETDKEVIIIGVGIKTNVDMLMHISNVKSVIAEHGISQALMKAVDPNGELIALGIYSSLESLPVIPTKDCDECTVAIEGLSDIAKKLISKVRADLKSMNGLFSGFFSTIGKHFKSWTVDLENAESKMGKVEVDEEKLESYQVKVLNKIKFKELGDAIEELIGIVGSKKIEELTKDVKGIALDGVKFAKTVLDLEEKIADFVEPIVDNKVITRAMDIEATVSKRGLPSVRWKVVNNSEGATVKRHGYVYNDIVNLIEEAKRFVRELDAQVAAVEVIFDLVNNIAIMNNEFVDIVTVTGDLENKEVGVEHERVMVYGHFTQTLYDFCMFIYKLLSVCVDGYFDIYQNTPITLAKAVIKTSK